MKKAYQRRFPTILKKKKPERDLALLRFGIQPLSAGCETPVPTPSPHCSDGRVHKNQDWELSARPWKTDCQRVRVHQEPPPTAGNTAWASSECFGASLAIRTCIGWWGGDDVVERKGQRGVTRRWELKLSVVLGSYRDGVTARGRGLQLGSGGDGHHWTGTTEDLPSLDNSRPLLSVMLMLQVEGFRCAHSMHLVILVTVPAVGEPG